MKRLILAFAILTAPVASASEALTETWAARAALLYQDTEEMLGALMAGYDKPVSAEFADELTQFAVTALRLGQWIDQTGGSSDYGCIFRGMAEEAELQLAQLEGPGSFIQHRAALKRLATLLDDAQVIAVASAQSMQAGARHGEASPACPASPATALQILAAQTD